MARIRRVGKEHLPKPSVWDLTKDTCGIVDSGITDLASNPKHLEGLGEDSMGSRRGGLLGSAFKRKRNI